MCASRSPNTLYHTSSPRLVLIHLVERLNRPAFVTCYGIIPSRKSPANPGSALFFKNDPKAKFTVAGANRTRAQVKCGRAAYRIEMTVPLGGTMTTLLPRIPMPA